MIEFYNGKLDILPSSDIKEKLTEMSKLAKEISMMSKLELVIPEDNSTGLQSLSDGSFQESMHIISLNSDFPRGRSLAGFYVEDLDNSIKLLVEENRNINSKSPIRSFSGEAKNLLSSIRKEYNKAEDMKPPEEKEKIKKLISFLSDARWTYKAVITLEARSSNDTSTQLEQTKENEMMIEDESLVYGDKKIELKKESLEYIIISYLLKYRPSKQIDFDVIWEDYDENLPFLGAKKPDFYQVCRRLNDKIQKEFGITDYLDYTTLKVGINN